jgi:hypothetical protein
MFIQKRDGYSMSFTTQQAQDLICPGNIIYINYQFPHQISPIRKYFVIAGIYKDNPLLLKINSKIKLSPKTGLKVPQFSLKADGYYSFLQNDSFLCCNEVWYNLSVDEITNQLIQDQSSFIGKIKDPHKNEILKQIDKTKSISNIHKKIIRDSLF